ncbi:MAG TPA: SDR family oxidoreductase [Usitatibacter sp.]|nr:SDR family oxidoreductase [Usitatibacter sp.]
MAYFVTGATGFIGRFLVQRLLRRRGPVYVLVRKGSLAKLEERRRDWGEAGARVIPVVGDLSKPRLGLSRKAVARLAGGIDHFFHLAAIYDLAAPAADVLKANVEGTRHALEAARLMRARRFHHMSSIAAAGLYQGVFREEMFEEAEGLDHPYFRSKHESEGLVRAERGMAWRIYRPGIVVGDSRTGEIDKVDGPYYFFRAIRTIRDAVPSWAPMVGIEGGLVNLVPVDYVARATDHLAHAKGLDGRCFHLTDPESRRVGDVLEIFAEAAHAPVPRVRVPLGVARATVETLLIELGVPRYALAFLDYPTTFDNRATRAALKGARIAVPPLESYAWRLWDYWERHLDPERGDGRSLEARVKGKVVVLTGGTSGIGEATAYRLGEAGARLAVVARDASKAAPVMKRLRAHGADARFFRCDLADGPDCERLVASVLRQYGGVDILVNNAGRSIRRRISASFDRFHDFERTMQLNYFGSLRLILGFLPGMLGAGGGHIVNVSSIGVLARVPRFSAYVASKAALDAFSECAASEFADRDVRFTTINMPLVRTPMSAPTALYRRVPMLSADEAAELVVQAIVERPARIATGLGILGEVLRTVAPRASQLILNAAFRAFPESAPEAGHGTESRTLSPAQVALAQATRGIHW